MMPPAEAGAPAQGGGPAGMGWARPGSVEAEVVVAKGAGGGGLLRLGPWEKTSPQQAPGYEGFWEGATGGGGGGEGGRGLHLHSPTFPSFPPLPLAPLWPLWPQAGEEGGSRQRALFTIRSPRAQIAYLSIPTLLKARASRSGETSGVLEDRKSRCFGQREQNRRRLGSGLYPPARGERATWLGAGTPLDARGRAAGPKSAPWKPGAVGARPLLATPPGHALPRWRLPRQESFLHGLCRPLRPHPDLGESDSAEPASLHLSPHTRSARRNYRIAGALLTRSNYPPPLFSAALCGAGPTRPN
ncbi:LOW QUALITY PROTEIN: uncharacterized protein C6orf223 homolog [Eumetopias jubatus]|uniref:LOW QUALITY PROTEIN: uncharacterized protein C6orf223 homolog n=1 Tax=Eumetopias jubatus TaxID=34886 RepID=UPI001016B862|nr:LOW QUALITY PROTEIN: uncharacterized protein C6orf223 homolog [Eumetopias jubatus]